MAHSQPQAPTPARVLPGIGGAAGFALLETVVAVGLLLAFAAGVAPLVTTSDGALSTARTQSATTALAEAKLQQLLALEWGFVVDTGGNLLPSTDTTTDLGSEPPGSGGPGLYPGSPDTVWNSTPGYVDYLDENGRWVGSGTSPPPTAVYVRRWAVTSLGTSPADSVVLEVVASALKEERAVPRTGREHRRGDSWLVTFATRIRP
jgi:type II secretory pathway pseudopilin PulG